MIKLWVAGLTALGYFAALTLVQHLATAELSQVQLLYTAAETQAATISASNR